MKSNSFDETIRRIEAERKAEAEAAVAAGWTEADHPDKCCPAEASAPQPKREGRSFEELEQLRDKAAYRAKCWAESAERLRYEIERADAAKPRFDHGMLQLSLGVRRRGMVGEMNRHRELDHAKERADHFARLAAKYTAQIEKRKP